MTRRSSNATAAVLKPASLTTRCACCHVAVKVDYDDVGRTVGCPACRVRFVVTTVAFSNPGESVAVSAIETGGDAAVGNTCGPRSDASPIPTAPSAVGNRIGRFEIGETLGRGGFGIVYRAHDPLLDRDLALKIPLFPGSDDRRAQRFLAEARAAGKLRHPHIVAVYESGEADGKLFIASEYVEGQTLADVLEGGRPGQEQAAGWVRDLAGALSYAHSQGIVHRDIKPQNIMIDGAGRPQIMDFGLAKRLDQDSKMTSEGALLGTPAYMSPEQARGEADSVGPRSDQYSLGTVLYELLTGRRPFDGSGAVVIARVAADDPPPPQSIDPEIPADLDAICRKAMDRDPSRRYSDSMLLAVDLDRWLRGDPARARPLSAAQRLKRWAKRRPLVASLTGLVAILLLGAMTSGLTAAVLTLSSKNELQRRLDDAQQQAELTRALTKQAEEAAESARVQTEAANRELERAQAAKDMLERAVADRDRLVEAKIQDEDRLTELIVERRQTDAEAVRTAQERATTEKSADAIQTAATAAGRQIYVDLLRQAQEKLNMGDRKAAGELLGKCPLPERRWEWRFLRAQTRTDDPSDRQWIVYSVFKEYRNRVKEIVPGTIRIGSEVDGEVRTSGSITAYRLQNGRDGIVRQGPTVGNHYTERISVVPDRVIYWTDDYGRTMPGWDDDPPWANVPPTAINIREAPGQIEALSPTGTLILTSQLTEKDRVSVYVIRIDDSGTAQTIQTAAAPMRRVAAAMQQKERLAMGFAFSRDASAIAQLSTVPADTKKSAIRTLPIPTGKKAWSGPDEETVKGMAAEARRSPGKVNNLARFYNEHTPDKSAQLVLESDMGVSPDGSRIAQLDKDFAIQILDRHTGKEILTLPSGLEPQRMWTGAKTDHRAFDPIYEISTGRALWSLDGKRLFVRIRASLVYTWGVEGGNVLRIPPTYFDCLIVLNAE